MRSDACKTEGGLRTRGCSKRSISGNPLITVITVVFNSVLSLEKTILSVINQSYDNIEFIIIDGGSTDGTVDIIEKYEGNIDYWVSEKDAGIYDAMNKAAAVAKGDWLYFLGADDRLLDSIHDIVKLMSDKSTIYYGDVYMPGKHALYTGKLTGYELVYLNICHQAIFYPAGVFKKHLYQTKYKVLADHALNLICYGDKSFAFEYVPVLVCIYNDTGGYSFTAKDPVFDRELKFIIRDNYSTCDYIRYRIRIFLYLSKQRVLEVLNRE